MLKLFIPFVLCGADAAVGGGFAQCNVARLADARPLATPARSLFAGSFGISAIDRRFSGNRPSLA